METMIWILVAIGLLVAGFVLGKITRRQRMSELERFYEQASLNLHDIEKLALYLAIRRPLAHRAMKRKICLMHCRITRICTRYPQYLPPLAWRRSGR